MTRSQNPDRPQWSIRIARIAGIDLRIHVSFLLIVWLFALDSRGPVAGVSWLATIFGCVTLHELAHSVVARARGIPVRAIMLLPIGGVSQLDRTPEDPRDELAIAIVGPLTSFAIAGVTAAAASLAGTKLIPIDLYGGSVVPRLVWFNVLLGVFNMLPAFPMDGGRVLRAMIAARRDRIVATHIAAQVGKTFAITMVAAGLLWNVWLSFIGIFVFFGATVEETLTVRHSKMKGILVRNVMMLDPLTVDARARIGDLKDQLRRTAQREFPVVSGGAFVGMLSAGTIESMPDAIAVDAADHVTPTLAPDQSLEDIEEFIPDAPATQELPVLEREHVVGLLRREDVERILRGPLPQAASSRRAG